MKTLKLSVLAFAALVTGFVSCGKKDTPTPTPTPAITQTDSVQAVFNPAGAYTYFSFKNNAVVAGTDSNSTKWDFAFRFVNIIVNSHASGPGTAGVITQTGIFNNFTMAPETGYAYDTTSTKLAINAKDRDPNAWYLYDVTVHALSPKAGQFFVFRTSDNHYVKMEILSVTTDVPFTNPVPPTYIWYKFRFTYQADGSRNF
jgi:hypothetical protein